MTMQRFSMPMMASKLEPHRQLILNLRANRRTWREIAAAVTEAGTPADASLVFRWFQNDRKRQAKINRELQPYRQTAATVADPIRTAAALAGERKQPVGKEGAARPSSGGETVAEIKERIIREREERKAREAAEAEAKEDGPTEQEIRNQMLQRHLES